MTKSMLSGLATRVTASISLSLLSQASTRFIPKRKNWTSIDVDVAAGETVFIRQHAKMDLVMARNTLSLLNELEGEYFVKDTNPGTMTNC